MGCVLILESKRVDYSKPQKYSDLRKLKQDKQSPLYPGENYYVHQVPEFPSGLKEKRYRYKEFQLDVYSLRCTCDLQKEKREIYKDRDIRKICRHLYYKISSSWIKQYVEPLTMLLMKSAAIYNEKHLYRYEYKKSPVIFGFKEETLWVNVYTKNKNYPDEIFKYSFNPLTKRWSYNFKPEYYALFEDVIQRTIKYNLTFQHQYLKGVSGYG